MSPSSTRCRRAKSRKQRFLSLSRELAAAPRPQKQPGPAGGAMKRRSTAKPRPRSRRRDRDTATRDAASASARAVVSDGSKPLDLFPMHPEPQALDDDDPRHAAAFFDDPDYYATTATLTSLLGPDHDAAAEQTHDDTAFSVPAAVAAVPQHAHSPASSTPRDLARSVLRGRERWVLCQQDGEEEGEASSCGVSAEDHHRGSWCIGAGVPQRRSSTQLCFLKLDYDEVISAWSGAGSVYVEGEAAQVVPDDHHHQHNYQDHYLVEQPAIFVEVGGTTGSDSSGSNLWVVPERTSAGGTREARVLRYKEKRQNRLFAKRIRYEVRKLNAQKRPRIKGRFVKRTQEQP